MEPRDCPSWVVPHLGPLRNTSLGSVRRRGPQTVGEEHGSRRGSYGSLRVESSCVGVVIGVVIGQWSTLGRFDSVVRFFVHSLVVFLRGTFHRGSPV